MERVFNHEGLTTIERPGAGSAIDRKKPVNKSSFGKISDLAGRLLIDIGIIPMRDNNL